MIVLPLPPSANRLWRFTSRGVIKSPEYRAWAQDAAWRVAQQWQQKPLEWFAVTLRVPPTRVDLGNREKPVLDSLQAGGAVLNDSRAQRITLIVDYGRTPEMGVMVELEPAPPPPAKPKRRKTT